MALVAAVPVTIPLWLIAGSVVGFVASAVAISLAALELRSWTCPRCGDPFIGARWSLFPERCGSCALTAFARPDIVRQTDFVRTATVHAMPERLRHVVAGAEIAGGGVVVAFTPFVVGMPLWFRLAFESVGAMALAAGIWLWRDDPRGYQWSRAIQALQLFRISLPPLAYAVSAGPYIDIYVGAAGFGMNFGFYGQLVLLWGNVAPPRIAFNLLALAWLLLLFDARSSRRGPVRGRTRFDVWWSEPEDVRQQDGDTGDEPTVDSRHD